MRLTGRPEDIFARPLAKVPFLAKYRRVCEAIEINLSPPNLQEEFASVVRRVEALPVLTLLVRAGADGEE
jgi:hypothetical protein